MPELIPKHGGYRKLNLRQRGLAHWERDNPLRQALIDRRCQTADEVGAWVVEVAKRSGQHGQYAGARSSSTESTASALLPTEEEHE